ncbi:major capsid protein [Flyfo microvirus Tbat2_108]|nr:major capsid protein [Flyfo microvirus Tbat2_108]
MAQAPIPTRHKPTALDVPRTRRSHPLRNMTSLPAGKVVPLAAIPLLREDDMSGQFTCAFEMQETVEILLNGIDVVVDTWLVPNLAFERFRTMDDVNLAYTKNTRPGETLVPYFETAPAGAVGSNEIHMRLGKHARPGQVMNMAYVEAYNRVVNFERSEVSPAIPKRARLDTSLAQALWPTNVFAHIVPDFDQAVVEGEVALNIAQQNLTLQGSVAGRYVPVAGNGGTVGVKTSGGHVDILVQGVSGTQSLTAGTSGAVKDITNLRADLQGAVAVLADNGITISLANIDMARKAQVFANIRKQYNLNEDMLIDLLMDGITVPEQAWRNPIKLRSERTRFGMAKRYASNGDALTESVVNGAAALSFGISVPRVPCGGVVMVVASIAPEQLFERREDPYLVATDPTRDLPKFIHDHLDPEQVEVVHNDYIDNDHDQPAGVYGFGPTNHKWNGAGPGIGGRFFRPEVDAGFDEDRQAIWAVETQNPLLTKDAYLVPADIHLKPFWTSTIDPFDCVTGAQIIISGNTQFGPMLIEALPGESDYDAILDKVDQDRIEKP